MIHGEWQVIGGSLVIPKGWFVTGADFDADNPTIKICCETPQHKDEDVGDEQDIQMPKPLAYYLSTHWCGSKRMHKTIEDNTRNSIREAIKTALGI